MPPTGRPAERRLAAVDRALSVLDAFVEAGPDAGTVELSRITGINPSTVSRLLGTLHARGYVDRVAATGRYRLGPHLLHLANHALSGLDLRQRARPHLEALEAATGETASLSVAAGSEAVTVDYVASRASTVSVARLGRPSVAHATAAGKVMLAFGGGALPPGELERFTVATVTDRGALAAEVDRVRRDGWARAEGERDADLNAIAAPVRAAGGDVAAILGVQGPAGRFDRARQEAALPHLLAEAAALSAALGHRAARLNGPASARRVDPSPTVGNAIATTAKKGDD